MNNSTTIKRALLRSGSAFQALALLGAGVATSAIMAAPAAAQDYTNVSASGRVQGTDGQGIGGASVTITSDAQGFTRSSTTGSDGSFNIPQIPPGPYTFEITASGFDTYTESGIVLNQTNSSNQFTLAAAGTAAATTGDDIVVTAGRRAIVDFATTTTGGVIEIGDLATRVPVARDLTSVIRLSPGTTAGDSAFGDLPNIAGGSVAENQYYINGLNVTEFREGLGSVTVPFEFYQTVEVKNGGFQAEFGRATGGVVNATSKSGSNEYHAGVVVNWEPDFLKSNNKSTILSENEQEYSERINSTFFLSGPIIKDRLFFYALYETRNVETTNSITSRRRQCANGAPTCAAAARTSDDFEIVGSRLDRSLTTSPFYAVKVDAIPFDGQRLEFTYFNTTGEERRDSYGYNSYSDNLGTNVNGVPGAGQFTGRSVIGYGGENYVGRYTGSFADWITVSAAYGKNEFRDITGSDRNDYPFIQDSRGGSAASIGNSVNVINNNSDEREFYRGDVDLYFNLFGRHHVKFGYDQEQLITNSTTSYTGGVAYQYFNSGPNGDDNVTTPNTDYVTGRTFVNGGSFPSKNEAYYIQDSWSLFNNRLTLNVGVRNDRFENENAEGQVFYASGDNWAPRLGFTFDAFGDGTTKLYGSYGRYFLPIAANTNIRLAGAELDFTRYNLLSGLNPDNTPIIGAPIAGVPNAQACPDGSGGGVANCTITGDGAATPTDSTVSKSLKAQAVDEFIVGVERNFGSRWKAGVYYTDRKLVRALEDVAIDAAVLAYCDAEGITGCDAIYTGFHQYVLVNPGDDATITLSDPIGGETTPRTVDFSADDLGYPKATRRYQAVTLTVDRTFDGVWSLSGSYTLSRLKGNYEGAVKSDNGQTDAGLTTDFDQPGLTDGTDGLSPNHRAHNFKLFGSYQLFDGLVLGANFEATSPRKFGCIGRVPDSADPFASLYGAAGFYCNVDANGEIISDGRNPATTNTNGALTPRGSVFESDWRTQLDVTAIFRVPTDAFDADIRFDVFNIFNSKSALDFEERGTLANGRPNDNYREATAYQTARRGRVQFALRF